MPSELLLIRHGQSEANVNLSTDPDCRLTSVGVDQARELGRRLAGVDLGAFTPIVSPYSRTQHTARLIAEITGLQFTTDDGIREWGKVATVNGQQYHEESEEELVERLSGFLSRRKGQKLLIVSHAAPIAVLTQLAWGEKPNIVGEFWAGVDNCCFRWLRSTITPPR